MNSHIKALLIFGVLSIGEFVGINACADQQTAVDSAVNFAKTLTGGVQTLSTTTDATTVPGYGGDTNLPQTNYYKNNDLNGLQTDAMVGINSGTANDASQYAYQKSLQPKLQFGANDPILSNSNTISTNATLNPDVLTVQTGSCAVANVNTAIKQLETCTSWLQPTQQTCNKTLNVDVKWDSISSCPIATTFSQVQALHNASGKSDYVYARAYCNPGAGTSLVSLQLKASDGDPQDCTDWVGIDVSTNQTTQIYSGALLRPQFYSQNTCINVPAFIQGGCDANNQCNYTVTYHELMDWVELDQGGQPVCNGTEMDLAAQGYPGPGSVYSYWLSSDPKNGLYCVRQSSSVNITFERPHITKQPTITDTWNDGCGLLEAQVQ